MPQILRIGPYIVYFWSNEGNSDYIVERWLAQFGEIKYFC